MTTHDDIRAAIIRSHPMTQPVNPLIGPFVGCDYEDCTRDAAYITRLEGPVESPDIGACDEHVVLLIEIVDQMITGSGTLTAEEN